MSVQPTCEWVLDGEESLDPRDWEQLRALSYQVVDDAITYLRDVRDRPVWQPIPEAVRARFSTPLPEEPRPLDAVYADLVDNMLPYPMGNIHPRFWMWYMGSSNFTGALGDFLAAVLGSNLGGGEHAASLIDQQVVGWLKQMVGFPAEASGTLVSGGSMANIIGLTVARNTMSGANIRRDGVAGLAEPLRYYASDQVHGCHQIALELLGLGDTALRRIPTQSDCKMDIAALRTAVEDDRAAGFRPVCVIASAGTVNTGAIDDLSAISDLCREQNMWFHVDGCIGAFLAVAAANKHLVNGLEQAHSIALDPHKWLHAPFEVGCALVRDFDAHHSTFSLTPEYLQSTSRGIASGAWLHAFGVQTSRGFRALKVWMALQEHGVEKFGRLIDQNIAQADFLASLVTAEPRLTLRAKGDLNIVCYRYDPGGRSGAELKRINTEVMLRMQEAGTAAVSDTTVHGDYYLRVAINNHRTIRADLEFLVQESVRMGDLIVAGGETEKQAKPMS